jgi:hypothetical protein
MAVRPDPVTLYHRLSELEQLSFQEGKRHDRLEAIKNEMDRSNSFLRYKQKGGIEAMMGCGLAKPEVERRMLAKLRKVGLHYNPLEFTADAPRPRYRVRTEPRSH